MITLLRNSRQLFVNLFTAAALIGIASSVLVAMPANAAGPSYNFNDTIESQTIQTKLCAPVSSVCNDTFGFGFLGKTLKQGDKDLPGLETQVGFKTNLTGWFQDFSEPLNVKQIQASAKAGRTPVITWEPQKIGDKVPDNYPLKGIIAGTFDKYLISSAKLAKSAKSEFVLRFAHEMNGYWYPWGMPKPGDPRSLANKTNTPEIYIQAFRYVHKIFEEQGADNVKWMWSPNLVDATPAVTLASLYPGDKYVDVVGLSGYLHGSEFMYEERFRPTLNQLDIVAPNKPIIIAEGGVDHALLRPMLTQDLLSGLSREPRVQGFLWLNKIADVYDYSLLADDGTTIEAIKDALNQPAVVNTPSYRSAVSLRASIKGEAVVGATVSAQGNYRGTSLWNRYTWLRCPTVTSALVDCLNVGVGQYHTITEEDRHSYLQVTLAVKSLAGYDYSRSPMFGPIFTPQVPATLPVAYTRGTSTQLVFDSAPESATHVVIKIDSGNPIYMPASTKEYWITNLALGSAHTFTISYADVQGINKLIGASVTGSFTAAGSVSAPTLTVFGNELKVSLTAAAIGQTAWRYQIDDQPSQSISSAVTSFNVGNLSVGAHTVSLSAISSDASTLVKSFSFNVLPTPVAPAISMQSGAIWLTFADQPAGIKSILIYVDDRNPVTIAAYGLKTYKISELTNGVTHTLSLRYSISDVSQNSIGDKSNSSFTLIPAPTTAYGKVSVDGITFTLPAVSPGQTGWLYSLDGGEKVSVSNDQPTIFIANPSVTQHTFSLQAVSGDGVTLAQNITFDYGSMPEKPTLNLRSEAVQFVFSDVPKGVTKLLLQIDGGDEQVISPLVADFWVTGLIKGSTHTYSLRYERMIFGAPSYGASITGSFALLSTPASPVIDSSPTSLKISLPTPVSGQQFWNYSLDGADFVKISSSITSLTLPAVGEGSHTFTLQAGAAEGFSISRVNSFTSLAAPISPAVNLRGASTQFVLPTTPSGVTAILVSVNNLPATKLEASVTEYWANNLSIGEIYTLRLTYQFVSDTLKLESLPTVLTFTPMLSPNQAVIDANGSMMVVTLPTAAVGQTIWAYSLNGASRVIIPVATKTLTFDLPGLGANSFELFAGTEDSFTLGKTTSFFKYAAPEMPSVNLRGTGTQLTFGAVPVGVAKIVLQVDSLASVPLSPTTLEYWINGLDLGSAHTFSVSYLYTNTYSSIGGEKVSGTFAALKSSDSPTLKISSTEYTVTLPQVAVGQTSWIYSLDSGALVSVSLDTLKLSLSVPSIGAHTFNLQAVSGNGTTLLKTVSFTYLAVPTTVQAVLSGTGTRMTFGTAPVGVTNLVVQVDDLAPVFLPTSTTEYWVNNLEKGSNHVFKAWYRSTATGVVVDSAVKTVLFVPLSAPAAVSVTVSGNSALVSLPVAATGQTGWLYAVDSESNYIAVDVGTATVIVGSLATGSHKFYLKAVGKDGITGSSVKTFSIS